MAKKKRQRSSNNPLSDARKSSKNFYQDLWHKKSGLGYTLFVQYYGQQPLGVVVAGQDKKSVTDAAAAAAADDDDAETATMTVKQRATAAKGMSRAAKRRRKKRGGTDAEEGTCQINDAPTDPDEATTPFASSSSSLLADALAKQTPAYAHLQPFIQSMSKPLPISFRLRDISNFNNNDTDEGEEDDEDEDELQSFLRDNSDDLQHELQQNFRTLVSPTPFGDGLIYQSQSGLYKNILSRTAPDLHQLLVRASQQGILARQEVGSMLPVLGLKKHFLKKNARVLDTCASPGSKTLQVLEVVGTKGRVYANDVHPKRLETLQEAVNRSGVSKALTNRLVYTNHDATVYPAFRSLAQQPHVVLTDVPCSGDGTIRKDAKTVLPGWSPATGRALHKLQLRILQRAVDVVRVGGIVSYSTCSLNPLENEAVIQGILQQADCCVELVEWPAIPGLVLQPGISQWKVLDYIATDDDDDDKPATAAGGWKEYESYQDAKEKNLSDCVPTLWPKKKKSFHLHYCRRLLPHDQDTGGFFVALLRKTK